MKLTPVNGRILVKKATEGRIEKGIYVPGVKLENKVEIVGLPEDCKNYSIGDIVYIERLSNKTPIMGLYAIRETDIICIEKEDDIQNNTPQG